VSSLLAHRGLWAYLVGVATAAVHLRRRGFLVVECPAGDPAAYTALKATLLAAWQARRPADVRMAVDGGADGSLAYYTPPAAVADRLADHMAGGALRQLLVVLASAAARAQGAAVPDPWALGRLDGPALLDELDVGVMFVHASPGYVGTGWHVDDASVGAAASHSPGDDLPLERFHVSVQLRGDSALCFHARDGAPPGPDLPSIHPPMGTADDRVLVHTGATLHAGARRQGETLAASITVAFRRVSCVGQARYADFGDLDGEATTAVSASDAAMWIRWQQARPPAPPGAPCAGGSACQGAQLAMGHGASLCEACAGVEVRPSLAVGAPTARRVWARRAWDAGMVLPGEYTGLRVVLDQDPPPGVDTGHVVWAHGFAVDALRADRASYLRNVRRSPHAAQVNVAPVVRGDSVVFVTTRPVAVGEELVAGSSGRALPMADVLASVLVNDAV
jgi:hypothetical protein